MDKFVAVVASGPSPRLVRPGAVTLFHSLVGSGAGPLLPNKGRARMGFTAMVMGCEGECDVGAVNWHR